ncbi:MAG: zf-HC2 domain-containing protein [bacterium]
MNCNYLKHHMDPYLDGAIKNADLAQKIRRHLDVCPECRHRFNEQRELKLAVANIVRDEPSPYLETRIGAAIKLRKRDNVRRGAVRLAFFGSLLGVFAAIIWLGIPFASRALAPDNSQFYVSADFDRNAQTGNSSSILVNSEITADEFLRFAVDSHRLAESEMNGMLYSAVNPDELEIVPAPLEESGGK